MSGCSAACGWCGRCTEAWEHPPDQVFAPTCDTCGIPIGLGAISLAGVGVFCSRACATTATEQHAARFAGQRG